MILQLFFSAHLIFTLVKEVTSSCGVALVRRNKKCPDRIWLRELVYKERRLSTGPGTSGNSSLEFVDDNDDIFYKIKEEEEEENVDKILEEALQNLVEGQEPG